MRHGYTNTTERRGDTVRKRYLGPDLAVRAEAERSAVTALAGAFAVPSVVAASRDSLTTRFVTGHHGQDLMDQGHPSEVLAACGAALHALHALDPALLGPGRPGDVIQHGDFGPNNVFFTADPLRAAVVLDWEFSGIGPAIADIAWCEWIVRMHHPHAVAQLPAFFAAYGDRPPWSARHGEMLRRCDWLEQFCRRWAPDHPGIEQWRARRARTARWRKLTDD